MLKPFAFVAISLIALALPASSADDNILRRDKGIVTYQLPTTDPRSLYAEVAVSDAVIATTEVSTLATLQLSDSSQIRIGDRTKVRIGERNRVYQARRRAIQRCASDRC
jgi:hypothetical protein